MNITSKSRYALKIMLDLAERLDGSDADVEFSDAAIIHRVEISNRQGIPLDYMDHILSRLKDAHLIASTRGRSGGYRLARTPSRISVLEIFQAVEDAWLPVQCLEGNEGCLAEHVCASKDAWGMISSAIRGALSGIILTELVGKRTLIAGLTKGRPPGDEEQTSALLPFLQECRAPKHSPRRRQPISP